MHRQLLMLSIMGLLLGLPIVLSSSQTSYGPDFDSVTTDRIVTKTFYPAARYAQNAQGKWVNASDVMWITRNADDITFHYSGIRGVYSLTFEVGVIYDGGYLSMSAVKSNVPQIDFSFPSKKSVVMHKYAVNISNIPASMQPNID